MSSLIAIATAIPPSKRPNVVALFIYYIHFYCFSSIPVFRDISGRKFIKLKFRLRSAILDRITQEGVAVLFSADGRWKNEYYMYEISCPDAARGRLPGP